MLGQEMTVIKSLRWTFGVEIDTYSNHYCWEIIIIPMSHCI